MIFFNYLLLVYLKLDSMTKIKPIDINPFVESYTVGDDNLLDEKYFFGYEFC